MAKDKTQEEKKFNETLKRMLRTPQKPPRDQHQKNPLAAQASKVLTLF